MSDNSLTVGGEPEFVLLASGLGDDTGGGLFAYDGRAVEQVDHVSTTGLHSADDRLVRALWCSSDIGFVGELLVYDRCGIERYHRLDAVSDPHDVLWDGEHFVLVSSSTNSILWISPSGEVVRRWQAPGEGDAWHLNSLLLKDGELLVSAFGRFPHHREWSGPKKDRAGFVLNLTTGEDVITGLSCPHHPRYFDDAWVVCNSATSELLRIDPNTHQVSRRLQLRAWTRGIAFSDTTIFVGESANRQAAEAGATASIAVISRQDWTMVGRLALPCREVYDLVLARRPLLQGVRRGFRTNPLRVAESDQHQLFSQLGVQPVRLWAVGDPLPRESCRVRVEADLPDALETDSLIDLPCTVENLGSALLVSAPPNPVRLSYKWIDPASGAILPGSEGLRTSLPSTLLPRQSVACSVKVKAPPIEGEFLLRVTLVQELVAWFDDICADNCRERLVRVGVRAPSSHTPSSVAAGDR